MVKVAVTLIVLLMVNTQVPMPPHEPLHPANFDPGVGTAVRVTIVPGKYISSQSGPQSIPGGLLVTGPGCADWASGEVRPYLEKYFAAAAPAAERLALLNLAGELLAGDYAGYQGVLALHAEGSLEAEKLVLYRSYDPKPAVALARRLAGL